MSDVDTASASPDAPGVDGSDGASPNARTTGMSVSDAAYLAEVRASVARLAVRSAEGEGAKGALAVLEDLAEVDVDVPVMGRTRSVRYVKAGVKLLAGWYLRYLGQQVTALGRATTDLGSALVDRTDRLEEAHAALGAQLADLATRLDEVTRPDPVERP